MLVNAFAHLGSVAVAGGDVLWLKASIASKCNVNAVGFGRKRGLRIIFFPGNGALLS